MVGPVSNYVSGAQQVTVTYKDIEDLDNFSLEFCSKNKGKYINTLRLVGFCLLTKREVLEKIGLFDEDFFLGFEDDDISLRALKSGYKLLIALDSFIHHYGHISSDNLGENFLKNYIKFQAKWKTDLYYFIPQGEIINIVSKDAKKILDIGCKMGATGVDLKNRQDCQLYGVECNKIFAEIAKTNYEEVIEVENLENEENIKLIDKFNIPYFDTIMVRDVFTNFKNPLKTLKYLVKYLKKGNNIIVSIHNICNYKCILQLLNGTFFYTFDNNALNINNLRFFTPNSIDIHRLFPKEIFNVKNVYYLKSKPEEKIEAFFEELTTLGKKFGLNFENLKKNSKIQKIIIDAEKI